MNIKKHFILLLTLLLFPIGVFADDVSTNSNQYTLDADDTGGRCYFEIWSYQ